MKPFRLLALIAATVAIASLTLPTRKPAAAMSELKLRNADIAFYESRVQRDPASAADVAQLAGLYLQRSRETGDFDDYRRAEASARRSLSLRTARNGKTYLTLASSLLAQHKFVEALEIAEKLVSLEPEVNAYRALLAEIQLELGDYERARSNFDSLADARYELAVAPRMARWQEIQGNSESARRILFAAQREAESRTGMPREQVAWFHLRVGDHEFRNGRLDEAERAFERGLETEPGDFRLLSALARVEGARGNWKRVIEYGERIGAAGDISTLGLIGDAYKELDDSSAAERFYREAERTGRTKPEPFNRQWTMFLLDHDREQYEVRALLEREIGIRRDVYGYDQLAWALYKTGEYEAARDASRAALRMGTRDAMIYYHAGVIESALGDQKAAARFLGEALAINPVFHPRQARAAQQMLSAIGGAAFR
ncbi:MAG: tetratricopeptide repeat protein [Gemmatimonadaceae bacterium]